MGSNSIIEAQIEFEQQENKLWDGIHQYKRPSIESIHPITGVVTRKDNSMLFAGLMKEPPKPRFLPSQIKIDPSIFWIDPIGY